MGEFFHRVRSFSFPLIWAFIRLGQMNTESLKKLSSRMPFTLRGVAAFSGRPASHLLGIAFAVACIVAVSVMWFAHHVWAPVIENAIGQLPQQGQIQHGQLEWSNASPAFLGEGPRFAILVDAEATEGASRVADVQLEFHRNDLKICSPFGIYSVAYPSNYIIGFNHLEAAPAWGAWKPALFAGLGLAVIVGMFASWFGLSLAAMLPLRLLAYLNDREATPLGCWRLAFAALMPGAVLMAFAIALYGAEEIELTDLLVAWPVHLVVGLVYAIGGVLCLPWVTPTALKTANPFSTAPPGSPAPKAKGNSPFSPN